MSEEQLFVSHIREALSKLVKTYDLIDQNLRPAAVLLPLFYDQGLWKLLFIHRSNFGEFHKGEVAFPGGKKEPEDVDLYQTALRETDEELGISPNTIDILGALPSSGTISGYLVTPIVGLIKWPAIISHNSIEIDRAFSIPLDWLMDPANWSMKEFHTRTSGLIETIVYKEYDNELLWGFSARVTQIFFEAIKKGEQ
ncbi:MAG: CoA pyrophosphatase [Anaerolineaceae bacterium]